MFFSMQTQITFVRHGENKPYSSGDKRFPGPGLTKKGIAQAKKTALFLRDFQFDRIYCSTMARAIETAEEIKKFQRGKISFHEELGESSLIIFDKKPVDKDRYKINVNRMKSTLKFFKRLLRENKGKRVLVVAHGNVIRCILGTSLNFKVSDAPHFHMPNCAVTTVIYENGKLTALPMVCFTGHHIKRGFRESLEHYYERVEFWKKQTRKF